MDDDSLSLHEKMINLQSTGGIVHFLAGIVSRNRALAELSLSQLLDSISCLDATFLNPAVTPRPTPLIDVFTLSNPHLAFLAFLNQSLERSSRSMTECTLRSFDKMLNKLITHDHMNAITGFSPSVSSSDNDNVVSPIKQLGEILIDYQTAGQPLSLPPYGICLLFLLQLMVERVDDAFHHLATALSSTWQLIVQFAEEKFSLLQHGDSSSTSHSQAQQQHKKKLLLQRACELQLILSWLVSVCEWIHLKNTSTQEQEQEDDIQPGLIHTSLSDVSLDNGSNSSSYDNLIHSLENLVLHYRIVLPLLSFVIRGVIMVLSVSERPDLVLEVLRMDKSVNYEQYAKLLTFDAFTGESSVVVSTTGDKMKEDDVIDISDDGYQYFQEATREECDEILDDKPIGTFMVRYQSSPNVVKSSSLQFFLSFKTSTCVKHAVIRREPFAGNSGSNNGSSSALPPPKFSYRCGSLGPLNNLLEILRAISGYLPEPLLFTSTISSPSDSHSNARKLPQFDINAPLWHFIRSTWLIESTNHMDIEFRSLSQAPPPLSQLINETSFGDSESRHSGKTAISDGEEEEEELHSKQRRTSSEEKGKSEKLGEDREEDMIGAEDEEQRRWFLLEKPQRMMHFVDMIVDTLTMEQYLNSTETIGHVLQKIYAFDLHQAHFPESTQIPNKLLGEIAGDDTGHHSISLANEKLYANLLFLKKQFLSFTSFSQFALSNQIKRMDMLQDILLSPLRVLVQRLQNRLSSALTLARPSSANMLYHMHRSNFMTHKKSRSERKPSYHLFKTCERLLYLLRRYSSLLTSANAASGLFRSVKFSAGSSFQESSSLSTLSVHIQGGTSAGGFVLSDCCEVTELLHTLHKYISEIGSHYKTMNSSGHPTNNSKKEMVDKQHVSKSGLFSTFKTSSHRPKFGGMISDDEDDDDDLNDDDDAEVAREEGDDDIITATLADMNNKDRNVADNSMHGKLPGQLGEMNTSTTSKETTQQQVIEEGQDSTSSGTSEQASVTLSSSSTSQAFFKKPPLPEQQGEKVTGGKMKQFTSNLRSNFHRNMSKLASHMDKLSVVSKSSASTNQLPSTAPPNVVKEATSLQRAILHSILHLIRLMHVDLLEVMKASDAAAVLPKASVHHSTTDGPMTTMSLAEKIVDIMTNCNMLECIVKPSELAFGLPQTYYHFVHPWEGKVLQNYAIASERCKLGRQVYQAAPSSVLFSKQPLIMGQISSPGAFSSSVNDEYSGLGAYQIMVSNLIKETKRGLQAVTALEKTIPDWKNGGYTEKASNQREEIWTESYLKLVDYLRVEQALVQVVNEATVDVDPHNHVTQPTSACQALATPTTLTQSGLLDLQERVLAFSAMAQSPFISTVEQYLLRNALLARLGLPYRFVMFFQVDIYSLKEIVALSARSHKVTTSNPTESSSRFNDSTSFALLPSNQMHPQSMDVYSMMKLTKSMELDPLADCLHQLPTHGSYFMGSGHNNSSANNTRPMDCGFVTPPKRLEARPSTAGGGGASDGSGAALSRPWLAQVGQSVDYELRQQGLFRVALPEYVTSVIDPSSAQSSSTASGRSSIALTARERHSAMQ
eukprot:scaffold428_cov168-Ochromonas_danica.AAC.44